MKLWEVKEQIERCAKVDDEVYADGETGEIFDEEAFKKLNLDLEEGLVELCKLYRNLNAEATAYKTEKARLDKNMKRAEKHAESVKRYIDHLCGGKAGVYGSLKVKYTKSSAVIVDDIAKVSSEYLKPVEPEVDKTAIKKAFKEGKELEGVHIEERSNCNIG